MLKYLSKFAMDILPSVAATIIGAYIVNHYINTKPAANAPVAAAVSAVDPKKAGVKPSEASSNIPESGVRAKGIPEKAVFERSVAEKVQEKAQEKPQEKAAEKTAERPTETASIPAETRRHQPAPRDKATVEKTIPEKTIPEKTAPEKTIAKVVPAPVQPAAPAVAPVIAAPVAAPTIDVAVTPEEHRDANDLARAAIERLRGGSEGGAPRLQEATRAPDPARGPDAPRVVSMPVATAPSVRPLPPPIMISTPAADAAGSSAQSAYPTSARNDDPHPPTPPADIPEAAPPLDLRAEVMEPAPRREHNNVAEDVLSAAKSVFHAVLPK
jgi:hypothetical protein